MMCSSGATCLEAIHSSNKIILVLTDHFVSSQWCEYEADQAILRSLKLNDVQDQDCNSSCVIPVILKKCKVNYENCVISQKSKHSTVPHWTSGNSALFKRLISNTKSCSQV
jgi:hypothetical protein